MSPFLTLTFETANSMVPFCNRQATFATFRRAKRSHASLGLTGSTTSLLRQKLAPNVRCSPMFGAKLSAACLLANWSKAASYDAAETVEAISASASGYLPSSWSIAFVSPPPPPLRLGLHLSTGRWLVFWRGLGGATGDATVGLWVEQVLNFGVLRVLGEDGEAWRGFERQAGGGIGLPGKTEKAERADCGSRSH